MIKILLTWIVVSSFSTPCPQRECVPNEYGMGCDDNVTVTLAIGCYNTHTTPMSKEFASMEEAQKFIDNAPKCRPDGMMGQSSCVKDFKIFELKE